MAGREGQPRSSAPLVQPPAKGQQNGSLESHSKYGLSSAAQQLLCRLLSPVRAGTLLTTVPFTA